MYFDDLVVATNDRELAMAAGQKGFTFMALVRSPEHGALSTAVRLALELDRGPR